MDNSTEDLHAPGSQLSVIDIIVITVYFALNVAVGIWVRTYGGPQSSQGRAGCQHGSCLVAYCLNTGIVIPGLCPESQMKNPEVGGCSGVQSTR